MTTVTRRPTHATISPPATSSRMRSCFRPNMQPSVGTSVAVWVGGVVVVVVVVVADDDGRRGGLMAVVQTGSRVELCSDVGSAVVAAEVGGKTTNCQHLVQYLVTVAAGSSSSKTFSAEKWQAVYSVLEAFGNASTSLNPNASRFTHVVALDFDQAGQVTSASIQTMLLEKTRVTRRPEGEATFNVFYYLLAGIDSSLRTELHLNHFAENHAFGIAPQQKAEDKQRASQQFSKLQVALKVLGVSGEEQKAFWLVLGAIYHLGAAGATKASRASGLECLEAMASGLYSELFNLLVSFINSFQDLCHNYTQERLQSLFHQRTFVHELERYKEENIELSLDDVEPSTSLSISMVDQASSQALVRTLRTDEARGLLWLLEEEVQRPGASEETLLERLFSYYGPGEGESRGGAGGGEGEAQGDGGGDASSLMQLDVTLLRAQLRGSKLLDALRIHRQGYPDNMVFAEFRRRFDVLAPHLTKKLGRNYIVKDEKRAVEELLEALDLEKTSYHMGLSRLFFRAGSLSKLEEQRDEQTRRNITLFQAACCGYLARRHPVLLKSERPHHFLLGHSHGTDWVEYDASRWLSYARTNPASASASTLLQDSQK
ncbi:hypothetical protein CRUP_029501 [Coryphaenoides rupestris]|nr:hypothetical protein CRUP_029501 [Coryphaenoides rupestris]